MPQATVGEIIKRRCGKEAGRVEGMARNELYNSAISAAIQDLPEADQENLQLIIEKLDKSPIKNFGEVAVKQTLMALGILLAEMPEQEFERMLIIRRGRPKWRPYLRK